jgi:NAD-dependent dihydropyrimidine dehydrogenase PreA subunit
MGMFIEISIDPTSCEIDTGCTLCVQLCPAEIFQSFRNRIKVNGENEDECTLCDLCVDQCPGKCIQVIKQY